MGLSQTVIRGNVTNELEKLRALEFEWEKRNNEFTAKIMITARNNQLGPRFASCKKGNLLIRKAPHGHGVLLSESTHLVMKIHILPVHYLFCVNI